jgi:hypothetical protein
MWWSNNRKHIGSAARLAIVVAAAALPQLDAQDRAATVVAEAINPPSPSRQGDASRRSRRRRH